MFLINSNSKKFFLIDNLNLKLIKWDYKKIKNYIGLKYKKQILINTFINNINISSEIHYEKDLIIYDLLRKRKYIIASNLFKKEWLEKIINIFYKFEFDKELLSEKALFYGDIIYLDKQLKAIFVKNNKDLLRLWIFEIQWTKLVDFYISFWKFSYSLWNYKKNFFIWNNTKWIDLNKQIAKNKMISEAVERISASLYDTDNFFSLNEIDKKYILNPFNLNIKDLKYVKIKHFLSKKNYYIPADYVFYPYNSKFIDTTSSWMATHLTYKKAKENALLELIERDVYIISYLLKKWIFKVDVFDKINNISWYILNLLKYLENKEINYYTFAIKLDNKIPIIIFVLEKNKKVLFSLWSDFIFSKAVEKAILEWVSMIEYLEKDYKQINYDEDIVLYHIAYYLNPKNFNKISWGFDINEKLDSKDFTILDIDNLLLYYKEKDINFYYYKFSNHLNKAFKRYTVRILSDKLLPIYFWKNIPEYILKSKRLKYWKNKFKVNILNKNIHPFG